MKLCLKCNQEKDESEFGSNVLRSDSLHAYCKKCNANYSINYYHRNKADKSGKPKDKCHRCGVCFGGPEYNYTPTVVDGYKYCESCVKDFNART